MRRFKQSFAWWCFARRGISPEHLIRATADIGYEAAELVSQEHWPLLKAYGLNIAAMQGHQSIEQGLNRREHHERIEKELRANIVVAEQWGIPNIIVFSGNRGGLDDRTGAEITAEGLRRVARFAEDAGVTLVLELLNSKVDHRDYQADRTAWGVEVCKRVGSPRVKLLYDIYHMQIMEGDIIRTIQMYSDYFSHYHTAGNPGRHELDARQELNYAAILRTLRDIEYGGYVGHEFLPTSDPIAALKQAFELGNQEA